MVLCQNSSSSSESIEAGRSANYVICKGQQVGCKLARQARFDFVAEATRVATLQLA